MELSRAEQDRSAEWREEVQCRDTDPDIFFPEGDKKDPINAKKIEVAKSICGLCVVQIDCLNDAIDRREPHGIWGGATEEERQRMIERRSRRAVA